MYKTNSYSSLLSIFVESSTQPREKEQVNEIIVSEFNPCESSDVSPIIRWKCQRLLQCCLGLEELAPMVSPVKGIHYCRRLEEFIFLYSMGNIARYVTKSKQIIFNLKQNGSFLMKKYEPSEFVALNDSFMAEGTVQEKKKREYEEYVSRCRSMLSNVNLLADLEELKSLEKCSKCGSTSVSYYSVQTRCADEGMTIFCTCENPKCMERWTYK